MKKKVVALLLAAVMSISLAACATNTAEDPVTTDPVVDEEPVADEPVADEGGEVAADPAAAYSGDVTIEVMLMPQMEVNDVATAEVVEAVNARLVELGYEFKIDVLWSGTGWGFQELNLAYQTGDVPDIVPAHSWSGAVTYTSGAVQGQFLRLDNPDNNLLEQYGPALYGNSSDIVKNAAVIPGDQGTGVYGYVIEKDTVQQLGFLVNQTALEELGFTLADFDPNDMTTWEPLFAAYIEANPGSYPFNVEGEVLDRAYNHVINVVGSDGPIGVVFNNDDPASTQAQFISRYENPVYKDFVTQMNAFYNAGYVDPDQGIPETAGTSVSTRRESGDFLISTYAYAPNAEIMISNSATAAQGKDVTIAWAPSWSSPISSSESALGSGLAVYSGTEYAPEAVTFLNLLASDQVIADLMAEGIVDKGYTVQDGIYFRTADRGGWANWRYGVVGNNSAATPLGDLGPTGDEWVVQKSFNSAGVAVKSGLFTNTDVLDSYNACNAVIQSYAVPFGSGALDVSNYETFIDELKAAGVDTVLEEALRQQAEFLAG